MSEIGVLLNNLSAQTSFLSRRCGLTFGKTNIIPCYTTEVPVKSRGTIGSAQL